MSSADSSFFSPSLGDSSAAAPPACPCRQCLQQTLPSFLLPWGIPLQQHHQHVHAANVFSRLFLLFFFLGGFLCSSTTGTTSTTSTRGTAEFVHPTSLLKERGKKG